MKARAANIGSWCLALSLALSACMVASGSRPSGAYFTDSKPGTITGTYARLDPPAPTVPYRLEAGGSKQLHWGPGDGAPACGDPIARIDAAGAMLLDFGEALPGHGDSRPDVFRLVSLADDPRVVTLGVTGPMTEFVKDVGLGNGKSRVLEAGDTERVHMQIRIPDDARDGVYTGTLTVHVQGWSQDAQLPMTITVCREKPKDDPGDGHSNDKPKDESCDGSHGETRLDCVDGSKCGGEEESGDRSNEGSDKDPKPEREEPSWPGEPVPCPSVETSPVLLPAVPSILPTPTVEGSVTPAPTSTPIPTDIDDDGANDD